MTVLARPRHAALDAVGRAAVEVARAAAVQEAGSPELVGEHLACDADGDRTVTHQFATTDRAYRGWSWAVTVTRVPRARTVTVSEVVLVPGPEALVAPPWVPWSDRIRPGDVGVGDLMLTPADDPRLVPAYAEVDDPEADAVAFELGLGRVRVLGPIGRDEAAQRWWEGPAGPTAALARSAPARCLSCGFWLPLGGSLGQLFGACGNVYSPEDGRVVAADHGCGAHSEALADQVAAVMGEAAVDDYRYEVVTPGPEGLETAGAETPAASAWSEDADAGHALPAQGEVAGAVEAGLGPVEPEGADLGEGAPAEADLEFMGHS